MTTPQTFGAREKWLHDATHAILTEYGSVFTEHFGKDGAKQLAKIRVSTGFPSRRGENGKVIGQCWTSKASRDQSHHVFINPLLEDPVLVLATLAHEMVHAADDGEHGHKGVFTKAVRGLGLEGKPTATFAGEDFTKFVRRTVKEIGRYPHVALTPTLTTKTQKTYMLKVQCPVESCGYTARLTEKWLDEGAPFCGRETHIIDGRATSKRIRMEEA
jgi:hypothetical protein